MLEKYTLTNLILPIIKTRFAVLLMLSLTACVVAPAATPAPSKLFLRSYTVLPTPQRVRLEPGYVELNNSWIYEIRGLDEKHIAVRTLLTELKNIHDFVLRGNGQQVMGRLRLSIDPQAVATIADPEIKRQAYTLKIAPELIEITGCGDENDCRTVTLRLSAVGRLNKS